MSESAASRLVRSAEIPAQPWANGGGVTRELLSGTGWRLSLADIDRPGPFSRFAGQRRLLTLVAGPVLSLTVAEVEQVVEPFRPFAFSGEDPVEADLPEGPVRVLNVIYDPAATAPYATLLELSRSSEVAVRKDQAVLALQRGPSHDGTTLAPLDLAVGPGLLTGRGRVLMITLADAGTPEAE
jgi:uncharacterized protein